MEVLMFQSPSLRGSGRFGGAMTDNNNGRRTFQSPSLRGSGRFGGGARRNTWKC